MDFFLSKPIRRPALKHVLKTYCPTIPEETEGNTPPTTAAAEVKANGAAPEATVFANANGTPVTVVSNPQVRRAIDESPAVSPMTTNAH